MDASMWYFNAVYKYLEYDTGAGARRFIMEEIYPALVEIIDNYKKELIFLYLWTKTVS